MTGRPSWHEEVVRQGMEDKLMTRTGDIRGCGMGSGDATVGEGAFDPGMEGANDGHAGVKHMRKSRQAGKERGVVPANDRCQLQFARG